MNREKELLRKRHYWKMHAYGITPERFEELVSQQGGVCKICKKIPIYFCIDHDHITGKIRGLLCKNCNVGLGYIEKEGFLEKALQYKKEHAV